MRVFVCVLVMDEDNFTLSSSSGQPCTNQSFNSNVQTELISVRERVDSVKSGYPESQESEMLQSSIPFPKRRRRSTKGPS